MIIFTSNRPLSRAENIKSVYDAYTGEKEFVQMNVKHPSHELHSGYYDLMVTDELPYDSPGKCLFIGHGMGALKKYGLDQPLPYFNRPDLITCAIASSEEMVPIVAKQCGIKMEQVIPLGMPRTDAYFNVPSSEEHYLYVPTYRDNTAWMPDFEIISNYLPDGEKIIVKLHMMTGDAVTGAWNNVELAPSVFATTPYLMKSKAIITDYSSLIFDAMVLRKPTLLFAKDRFRYFTDRGFYFRYPDKYSRFYFEDEKTLAENLNSAEWSDFDEELRTFYTGACDGHSVERVLELIHNLGG